MISRSYLAAIGWTLLILAACSIPGKDIPRIQFDLFEPDKIAHFTLFFVLGGLWMHALPETLPGRKAWVALSGIAYAILTEIYQGLLPFDRTPDPADSVANIIGLFLAISLYPWIKDRLGLSSTRKT